MSNIFCSLSLGPEICPCSTLQIQSCRFEVVPKPITCRRLILFTRRLLNVPFRLNFKLWFKPFRSFKSKTLCEFPLTTCAPCGSGCFVSWLWLLCDPSMTSIFTRLPWMLTTQKITEEMEETNSEKDFPVPRCIVKNREPAARSKDKTSCKGKSEERCKQRSAKCKWCETKWQCPGKEEYWSRGEPLSPWEDLWRQLKFEFQKYARVHSVPLGRRLSRCLYEDFMAQTEKNWALPNVRCSNT